MSLTGIVAIAILLFLIPAGTSAQGIATTGIQGVVTTDGNREIDARIDIAQAATGLSINIRTANGAFLALGLDPGGPYEITVHSVGLVAERRTGVFLSLGTLTRMRFVLVPVPTTLDTLKIIANHRLTTIGADGGASMTMSAPLLDHLLTLDRNVYDFLRLVPQISTKIGLSNPGISAAGVGFRFNNFLIDGVSERTLGGNVSRAFGSNTSVPLDAVQEYQVLIAPFDIRYGDFAGALVNAVTKSGTNTFHGSAFAYGRNDHLQRGESARVSPYQRLQYGLSLGGPIIRDRLHFFVATQLQQSRIQADGPYTGQPDAAERPVPVTAADLDRFATIMKDFGLTAGSAGKIENGNPLHSLFTRLDLAFPSWNSRLLAWTYYSSSDNATFSRAALDTFSLSTYQMTSVSHSRSSALDFHTALPRASGGHNEFLVSYRTDAQDALAPVEQPIIRVSVPGPSGDRVTLNSGTNEGAQGLWTSASASTVKDNLTLPVGARHIFTLGVEAEHFGLRRAGSPGTFGTWNFSSLQNLELGVADTYDVRIDFGTPATPLHGTQYAIYGADEWRLANALSVTGGIRADMLTQREHAPYNRAIDSTFGRRTDEIPRRRVEISPRFGFVWQPGSSGEHRVRGGTGIFTSRYPLAWVQSAVSSYGVGGVLHCSALRPGLPSPPAFSVDPHAPPTACSGGATVTAAYPGDVDLLDRNLRLMRALRGSLAYDRALPLNLSLTNEVVITHGLSDFAMVNLNLADPQIRDAHGRVMYGTIAGNGVSAPARRSPFSEVIDLRNAGATRSYELSTRLEAARESGLSGSISYTYSHARDAQTLLRVNTRGTVAWASARVLSGRQDVLSAGISSNDVPNRVVVAGTYSAPRARTSMSFYYIGESGRPFTFIAYGASSRGDLNADGSNANDPIYVPRSALDSTEIVFSGTVDSLGADNSASAQANRVQQQQRAFESFIDHTSCLRHHRGRILQRNTCREPWSNSTIASVRQGFPVGGRSIALQLDVFNVLNVLNRNWGSHRQAVPGLLEQVGETTGSAQTFQPIFRFHPDNPTWTTLAADSDFQLQLSLRYRF
jgi:hypothetical protein